MLDNIDNNFATTWDAVQAWCFRIAKMKGFHDKPRDPLVAMALIHTEVSEVTEALRKDPDAPSEHIPDFTQLEEELADIIIRVFDFAEEYGAEGDMRENENRVDVIGALFAKVKFNSKRPYKHGKRC